MLKPICLTLPEKMIQQIDEMLLEKDFASRSDFIRHLVRMWFAGQAQTSGNEVGIQEDESEEVDLEFGIPPEIVREIEIEARRKLQN